MKCKQTGSDRWRRWQREGRGRRGREREPSYLLDWTRHPIWHFSHAYCICLSRLTWFLNFMNRTRIILKCLFETDEFFWASKYLRTYLHSYKGVNSYVEEILSRDSLRLTISRLNYRVTSRWVSDGPLRWGSSIRSAIELHFFH